MEGIEPFAYGDKPVWAMNSQPGGCQFEAERKSFHLSFLPKVCVQTELSFGDSPLFAPIPLVRIHPLITSLTPFDYENFTE